MRRRRVLWSLVAIAIFVFGNIRVATACLNAVLSMTESVSKLKEAEASLDEGDIEHARALAHEVSFSQVRGHDMFDEQARRLHERALGVMALTYIRDPSATPKDLEQGLSLLDSRYQSTVGDSENPAHAADYGEALERLGKDREALDILAPLADRDLIGSAYAYSSLHRAALHQGDLAHAKTALVRCEKMAASERVCRGEYPRPPLLRAKPLAYFAAAIPFLLFAIARLFSDRRPLDRLGRERPNVLWSKYATPLMVSLTFATGLLVTAAAPTSTSFAIVLATLLLFAIASLQRRLFLRAVRLGKIADLKARVLDLDADGPVPIVRMFFGPTTPLAVERRVSSSDPGYRDNAHNPVVLGMSRRIVPTGLVVAGILLSILLLGCASMMLTMRG